MGVVDDEVDYSDIELFCYKVIIVMGVVMVCIEVIVG